LYELSERGEDDFNFYAPDIIQVCYKHLGVYPKHTSYAVCYRETAKLEYAYNL
jgi:hypothetical protein